MTLTLRRLASLLFLTLIPSASAALPVQFFGSDQKAEATLYSRIEDGVARAAIEIEIDRGWHLYHDDLGPPDAVGKPTVLEFGEGPIAWGKPRFPEPHRLEQPGLGEDFGDTWIWGHEGKIVVYVAGRLEPGAIDPAVSVRVTGLTCQDDGSCVPYKESLESQGRGPDALFAKFPVDLTSSLVESTSGGEPDGHSAGDGATGAQATTIVPRGVAAPAVDYDAVTFPEFRPQGEERELSLFLWLLLAFVAGMILNVMPCVLPVISIKVLSFVQQAGEDKKRILHLGLAFAAGILIVFLALAGVAIGAGLSWGEQFQSSTFLIVMIGIVFAFALSLFGVFEVGVPQSVGQMAGSSREGIGDAFFKGMLATVLATPCSGPFLGSTLTWTLAQPPLVVFLVFTMLGLGMAFPYVVLTANPGFLKILPRPGAWMETFKQAMGFVLLATVIYLMVSLRQDLLLFTAAFLTFVALGCWWWGRFARLDQSRFKRLTTLAVSLGIAVGGARLSFVDFRGLFTVTAVEGECFVDWIEFDHLLFEEMLADGTTVFVDFTADWCPNCKWNERVVFNSDEVCQKLREKGVVSMKADITHDTLRTDMLERLLEDLGGAAIPFLAVFPGDRPFEPFVLRDVVTVAQMIEILDACPDPPQTTETASR